MLRPRSVVQVRLEGKTVQPGTLRAVQGFFSMYILLLLLGTLMGGFGFFSPGVKIVLIFEMLLGRLELYPILLLFFPATWRAK